MQMNIEMPTDLKDEIQKLVDKSVSQAVQTIQKKNEYGDYLDIGTAAKYLGVSRGTFTNKILKRSNIPVITIGGRITRFKKSDLDKYMSDKAI